MSLAAARQRARRERRRTERCFRTAPFPLYGLPPSWQGGRFLGGGSWHGQGKRQVVTALSLVHGTLVVGKGLTLVVETALPSEPRGGDSFRVLAEEVWSGRAQTVAEALDHLRVRSPDMDPDLDTAPPIRARRQLLVNNALVEFDVFSRPAQSWVASGTVGGYRVTLEAQGFRIEGLELVQVTDLEPYIQGTRRFEGGTSTS
jgi:hypothetical protein